MTTDSHEISLLVLAADSGEGQFIHLVDPELKNRLEENGIEVQEAFASMIAERDLELFDVVLLMRTPILGHPKNDATKFEQVGGWLERFVARGGGLMVMFAESYGKSMQSMNAFAARFGIGFAFNRIVFPESEEAARLPLTPESRLLTCDVLPTSPFEIGVENLQVPTEGGHGTQALACLPQSEDWVTIMRGRRGTRAEPFPENHYAGTVKSVIEHPIIACCRAFDDGRILAFPVTSPMWIASSYLERWKGFLMEQNQGAGLRFTIESIRWCAGTGRSGNARKAAEAFKDRPLCAPEEFSFKTVSPEEQKRMRNFRPIKCWIGTPPTTATPEEIVGTAADNEYEFVVVVSDYAELDAERWTQLKSDYESEAKKHGILAIPGYEMLDDEGVRTLVFNVDALPEQRRSYPNSNLLEDLLVKLGSYSSVLCTPFENRLPPWMFGGFNLMELSNAEDHRMYVDRVASTAFIAPVVCARNGLPGDDKSATYVLAETPADIPRQMTGNRHSSFVTDGPILKEFQIWSDNLIEDDWEGFWTEYAAGDTLNLSIDIESEIGVVAITVFDGKTAIADFAGNGAHHWRKRIELQADHDLRLHVTAIDIHGGKLRATYPVYTRNRLFWAHTGGDQMNDYHNVWIQRDDGPFGIGQKRYDSYGFVTLGFGWGDYVRVTPSIPWSHIMPQGIEISSLTGNFKSLHPSPFMTLNDEVHVLNGHKRQLAHCTQDLHIVRATSHGPWIDNPGDHTWSGHNGKTFTPTRIVENSDLWRLDTIHRIPRWQPYGLITVSVEQTIRWLKPVSLENNGRTVCIVIAHTFHTQTTPDLELTSIDRGGHLVHSLPCRQLQPCGGQPTTEDGRKDWDNLVFIEDRSRGTSSEDSGIPVRGFFGTARDPNGNAGIIPISMPGSLTALPVGRGNGEFGIEFRLHPERTHFKPGDTLKFAYLLAVTPGATDEIDPLITPPEQFTS